MTEVLLWVNIAKARSKACLLGLYSFERWKDGQPIPESVVLDVIALKGEKEILEKLGTVFLQAGKQSIFLFDGADYLLIVEHDGTPLEKIKEPAGTTLIQDIYFKFVYPGTENPITGNLAELIKRFKK